MQVLEYLTHLILTHPFLEDPCAAHSQPLPRARTGPTGQHPRAPTTSLMNPVDYHRRVLLPGILLPGPRPPAAMVTSCGLI